MTSIGVKIPFELAPKPLPGDHPRRCKSVLPIFDSPIGAARPPTISPGIKTSKKK
jgi:hypothetical protein